MIVFDATYLVVLLHPSCPPPRDRQNKPVPQFKERIEYLASEMDFRNDLIGIPTPAMCEVLVRAGAGRAKYVKIMSDTIKFQLLSFDSRAAIEASELIADMKSRKEKWGTWAKMKFDIQIVSIAKAEGCSVIYSDDIDIEKLATRAKIKVIRICDLPLPPPPPKPMEKLVLTPMSAHPELPFPVSQDTPLALPSAQPEKDETGDPKISEEDVP